MSVQLVVYPQWYNGVQTISVPSTQMVASSNNMSAIATGAGVTGNVAQTAQLAINGLYSGMIANTWYGRYNNTLGSMTANAGGVLLYAGYSCILQKLSGLVAGALYDVEIENDSNTPGSGANNQGMTLRIFNNNTLSSSVALTFSGGTGNSFANAQFTAPSSNDTILVVDNYYTATNVITAVSVIAAAVQPPQPIQQLNNGSVICDLYEDEDLPLTLSVDNFKNAAEKVQSYSKAFNLPATKRNNKIFDNIFEITRNIELNSILFNPLKRTKAVLKQDGFLIFEGFLRMLDISEKDGEISYNVNLYAEVTALADTLKDRTFQDLGFTELEHEYNRTNIQLTWKWTGTNAMFTNPNTSGFRHDTKTVKYPFVDWNHQMVVSNGILGTAGQTELLNLEQAFRPFISIKYLVDRIFQDSPFTYTSTFLSAGIIEKLFMDFNWGAEQWGASPVRNDSCDQKNTSDQAVALGLQTVELPTNYGGVTDLWDSTNNRFVSDVANLEITGDFYSTIKPNLDLGFIAVTGSFRICHFDKYGNVIEILKEESFVISSHFITKHFAGSFGITLQVGEYVEMQVYILQLIGNGADIKNSVIPSYLNISYQNEAAQVSTLLDSARADVNQWEFLKGIMTMFNLIAIPDPDDINNLIIETYENIFIKTSNGNSVSLADRGITHNWTEKVDYSTMKMSPLADLKAKTIFKFVEDDDDYAFNVYKRDVQGHLYGSKVFDAVYSYELNLLTGEDEIVAEPFAATVIKPLMSQYSEFVVPSIYAMSDDGTTEGFANAPRIMYDDGKTYLSGDDYYVPEQNGVAADTLTEYLQFTHFSDAPTIASSRDLNFGVCPLIPSWAPVVNNLFQLYWMPYYSELYDPNTRIITVKINLNAGDINTFKFNDQIMLKNRAYRVNKIDYKPNDLATVELILLNYI